MQLLEDRVLFPEPREEVKVPGKTGTLNLQRTWGVTCSYVAGFEEEDLEEKTPVLLSSSMVSESAQLIEMHARKEANALGFLYLTLNERDVWYGLWQRRSHSQFTKSALSYQQFGWWTRAQDSFFASMRTAHSKRKSLICC